MCKYLLKIWGPSKTTAFFFSLLIHGKAVQKWAKQSPSLFKTLTICFIKPSLMCNGGNAIFIRSACGELIAFCSQLPIYLVQVTLLSLIADHEDSCPTGTKKHGYFVYPDCWPSRKFAIFRLTHMIVVIDVFNQF